MMGLRYSRQKELILSEVLKTRDHPSADAVYARLKAGNPNLSLATVYRNLNRLAYKGKILKICLPNASDRFDSNPVPHYHIQCVRCGKLCDVKMPYLDKIDSCAAELTGFTIEGHCLIFHGICPQCNKNSEP